MRLQWKGRSYRPATNFVKVYKPDVNELIKPLSMKAGLGSAILTGQYISGKGNEPVVPVITPSPTATAQVTPTPSITASPTLTPSVTPSSTPFPFVQPSLWFDASDSTTMNLILSGGTTYISQLTSKGTETWTLTGQTSDRYPTYSASTSLPGNPNIIRFTPNATAALRKGLVAFDRPTLTHTGSTLFVVWSQPAGTPSFVNQLYSGNTNGTLVQTGSDIADRLQFASIATNIGNTNIYPQNSAQTVPIPAPFSATNLNGKYLLKVVLPANPGFGSWELNQSAGTSSILFTGTTVSPRWNAINIGCTTNTTQQLYSLNSNIELAEMMVYNYELSSAEQEAVELYLKDKWRYDEWASPVPTPTATPQVTATPTPSVSPTVTPTLTNSPTVTTSPTPSSTPPAFSPSGVTNLQYWFMADSGATVSSWTNYGGQGGSATQTAAANQPVIKTNSTLGSFTGTSVQFLNSADFMTGTTSSLNIQNHTSYIVYKPVTSSSSNFSIGLLSATTYNWFYQNWESAGTGSTRMNRGQYRTPAVDGAPHLIVSSGSTTGVIASRNDVLGVSATTATTGVLTDRYNLAGGGGANTADYQLFEWIFYSRQLTSTEHANVINYLKTKYQYNTW